MDSWDLREAGVRGSNPRRLMGFSFRNGIFFEKKIYDAKETQINTAVEKITNIEK